MDARIMGLIVLLLEIRGISLNPEGLKWKTLIFYTEISNMLAAVSAAALLIFGQPLWVTTLRYLSSCMLAMTFVVTVCVLVPMGGDPKRLLWSGIGLYHHLLCPVISTLSYICIENSAGRNLTCFPVVVTLLYGLTMLYLNGIRKVDGPYPFLRVHDQSVKATVLWIFGMLALIAALSTLVWAAAG